MAAPGGEAAEGDRQAALALHRAGRLDEADAAYRRLLAAAPQNADLMGLLGVIALQQQDADAAEELLTRAIGMPAPEPKIHLRNLNNLFALFQRQGRAEACEALAGEAVPDWPAGDPPDAAERSAVLSLAEALGVHGQPERALSLVESLLPSLGEDAEALGLAGRLRLKCGDPAAALPELRRACAGDPGNWRTLAALSLAHQRNGDAPAAGEAARRCARAAPVYLAPGRKGQEATILVLNRAPTRIVTVDHGLGHVHFTKNYVSAASRLMAGEFRFASVIADLPDAPPELPEADLVYNNLAGGEMMSLPGQLDRAVELAERPGRPVINHPRAEHRTTRQKTADLLQGIPGLRVPRIARYQRDMAVFHEIAADIAARFTYPVIIRHVAADSSSKLREAENRTATLVHDAAELRSFLQGVGWPQFYAIQYADLRKADGNFRKLRAAFIGDEIILGRCQFDRHWMVGGLAGRAFYSAFPDRAADLKRILADPEAALGAGLMPTLRAVRARMPLDVFGMDFDIDDAGEIVLFEAQSTMNFIPERHGLDHYIAPKEPGERIRAAFRRLILSRIGRAG